MLEIKRGIPYCAGCSRKEERQGMEKGTYFCSIVADTPMKGIVRGDIDGTKCVEMGGYIPIDLNNAKEKDL